MVNNRSVKMESGCSDACVTVLMERPRKPLGDPFVSGDGGFTTFATVIALLLVLALVFSTAQVYWLQSESSDIQFVADSAAMAGENVVAEYYVLSKVVDAIVLSMSLLALSLFGIATVLCCIPPTIPLGIQLEQIAVRLSSARNRFASAASGALDKLQEALPFLCAVNSALVISKNSDLDSSADYMGVAIPLPIKGSSPGFTDAGSTEDSQKTLEDDIDKTSEKSQEIDALQKSAESSKLAAYMADCGNSPGFCMYQRAATLSSISGASNPYYSSVSTWSFSVPLERAKSYYAARLSSEHPATDSIDEKVRSECRKKYYSYALEQLKTGYVNEGPGQQFSAYFPSLPSNTDEMRTTHMYTDRCWPVSSDGVLHGSAECPGYLSSSPSGYGSLSDMDAGTLSYCPICEMTSSALGKVGAPSSSIENGFEYHYKIVANAANEYQQASAQMMQSQNEVIEYAGESFETVSEAMEKVSNPDARYDPEPPGRHGCISVVVDLKEHAAPDAFGSTLLGSRASIGPRVSISAAALGKDDPEEGNNLISSLLDGVKQDVLDSGSDGLFESGLDWILDLWGDALSSYCEGMESFADGIKESIDSIPGIGSTPLGSWAKSAFESALDGLGITPVDLSTPKPVLVNSIHVLDSENESLADAISVARGYLGTGVMPEDITIDGPFGVPVTIALPDSAESVPGAVLETIYKNTQRILEGYE